MADNSRLCLGCLCYRVGSKRAIELTAASLERGDVGRSALVSNCNQCRGLYESGLVDGFAFSLGVNGGNDGSYMA